jgi:hypothetical protein
MQIRSLTALASKFLVLALVLAGAAWAADSNAGTWKLNTAKLNVQSWAGAEEQHRNHRRR